METDEEDNVKAICDMCGREINVKYGGLYSEGVYCPECGTIFCWDCAVKYPITLVKVREDGPAYKQNRPMCKICYKHWVKTHPKQVKLDAFQKETH